LPFLFHSAATFALMLTQIPHEDETANETINSQNFQNKIFKNEITGGPALV